MQEEAKGMQKEARNAVHQFNIWTGGELYRDQALEFWGQVFAWPQVNGKVVEASSRDEKLRRMGLMREFLAGLRYDHKGAAATRLYFDLKTYREYSEETWRFFGLLQSKAQKKKLFWWVVKAPTGHKGFNWGSEVPEGDHIIYGDQKKTPQHQGQPTEREEEDTPHYPPNSDEPPL